MTHPTWLIEADVYGSEIEPLVAEIRRQGMACRYVTYREIVKGPAPLPPGSCAIVYGTYPTVRHAMLRLGWRPGGWCSSENLDCAAYYPHFAPFLLNQQHEIIAGVDAIREKERLFRLYGNHGCVFARPTSVHKLFVGRLIAESAFETALAPTRYDPETKIVVAKPRVSSDLSNGTASVARGFMRATQLAWSRWHHDSRPLPGRVSGLSRHSPDRIAQATVPHETASHAGLPRAPTDTDTITAAAGLSLREAVSAHNGTLALGQLTAAE
ncbi:MAG: hypothetical protein FJ304_05390 [Planctomycetes bacterium]|nr:hypothetical protein [Planctomycetota bacterium]